MSRHVKIATLSVFLILLSVPVVYTVVFWSIEQPLRYRCITALPEEMVQRRPGQPQKPFVPFIFEVRNTRSCPVYFESMGIATHRPGSPVPGRYVLVSHFTRSVRDKSSWAAPSLYQQCIPAHGVTRFEVLIPPEAARQIEAGKVRINSTWSSAPRKLVFDTRSWWNTRIARKLTFASLPHWVSQCGPATLEGLPVVIPLPTTNSPAASPPP